MGEIPANKLSRLSERGPWKVAQWPRAVIALESDDFRLDAALEISGDFRTHDEMMQYAEALAAALNSAMPLKFKDGDSQ
jgi:hypothetical protein